MKQYNDKKQAKRLLKRFKLKDVFVIGDRGYYFFYLFTLLRKKNNIFIVPPIKSGGKEIHRNLVRKKFQETFYKYKDLYNKRSNVEGVFSSLKRTILSKIVSKNFMTKKREVAYKIIVYNMKKNVFQTICFLRNFLNFKKNLLCN